jgi:hypothetical protein
MRITDVGVGCKPILVVFDERSPYWSNDHCLNMAFLRQIEKQFRAQLLSKGSVLAMEVLDAIGVKYPDEPIEKIGWRLNNNDYLYSHLEFEVFRIKDQKCVVILLNVDPVTVDKI